MIIQVSKLTKDYYVTINGEEAKDAEIRFEPKDAMFPKSLDKLKEETVITESQMYELGYEIHVFQIWNKIKENAR